MLLNRGRIFRVGYPCAPTPCGRVLLAWPLVFAGVFAKNCCVRLAHRSIVKEQSGVQQRLLPLLWGAEPAVRAAFTAATSYRRREPVDKLKN